MWEVIFKIYMFYIILAIKQSALIFDKTNVGTDLMSCNREIQRNQ